MAVYLVQAISSFIQINDSQMRFYLLVSSILFEAKWEKSLKSSM